MIKLHKLNETYIQIECDGGVAEELYEKFSFFAPNYQFDKRYKKFVRRNDDWVRLWDGQIHLFSKRNYTIYFGLLKEVIEFFRENKYEYSIEFDLDIFSKNEFNKQFRSQIEEFVKSLKLPLEVRDYQFEALCESIRQNRLTNLVPTASGKSLIIYLLTKFYDMKTLIICPRVGLVDQLALEFADYGENPRNIHKIYEGQALTSDRKITISTWQSLVNVKGYDVIMVDEVHEADAKTLKGLMESAECCTHRFGFTGTLRDSKTNQLVINGLFGNVVKFISTKEMQDRGFASPMHIKCITLKHETQAQMSYQDEIKYLCGNEKRNKFIINLLKTLKGNTIVFCERIDKHLDILHQMALSEGLENVHLVCGKVDSEDREDIRLLVRKTKYNNIFASYGAVSTGTNIPNIDNMIFASPSKGKVRVLQSLGRGLRLSDGKDIFNLYDLSDDLGYMNHTKKHLIQRITYYNQERFDYSIETVKL